MYVCVLHDIFLFQYIITRQFAYWPVYSAAAVFFNGVLIAQALMLCHAYLNCWLVWCPTVLMLGLILRSRTI
jgi:hypothetical protein